LHCPSSPLPKNCSNPPPGTPGGTRIAATCYFGIAGGTGGPTAADHLIPQTVYNEQRWNIGPTGTADCCGGGIHSSSGTIVAQGRFGLEAISDGTSNVLMVSESSNWVYTANNTKQDWRSSGLHGWIIGWQFNCTPNRPSQQIPGCSDNADMRTFNFMTVRYPINHFSQPAHGLPNNPGHCGQFGVCFNTSSNRPLNSAHPGGVNGAMADGSVRFFSQTLARDVLGRYVHRDDGLTTSQN
jgi:prepilin-type processing-associated H-X9-DG protein